MSMEQDAVVVYVDPDLEDLIPGFFQNRQKDIQRLSEALEQGDYETISGIGHSMKGAGGGYGFDRVTDLGAVIEEAAKAQDKERIREAVGELAEYMSRVEVVYE